MERNTIPRGAKCATGYNCSDHQVD